jgi:hypothetical protein
MYIVHRALQSFVAQPLLAVRFSPLSRSDELSTIANPTQPRVAVLLKPQTRDRVPIMSGRGSRIGHRPGGARVRKTLAGAAVPVPVSGERPARVLAGGTQSHLVFMICACLRAGAGPS